MKYKPKTCAICNKDFVPQSNNQLCCSPACKTERKKQRDNVRYNETRSVEPISEADSIKKVILQAWQRGDNTTRAILQSSNPDIRFFNL